jgi:SAM-dependent methyltransferase
MAFEHKGINSKKKREVIMGFSNSYEDAKRAEAYAKLEFPGTYYLAYRDLPEIIFEHVKGRKAIDFGCGTGRSTKFLQKLGFEVGVDIAEDMLKKARQIDPRARALKEIHPYETPEITAVAIVAGSKEYPGWLHQELKK